MSEGGKEFSLSQASPTADAVQAAGLNSLVSKEAFIARAEIFAVGRISAQRVLVGPTLDDAKYLWKPRLAGRFVRNATDPEYGFGTSLEAKNAAREYRRVCREYIKRATSDASQASGTNTIPPVQTQEEDRG